MKGPWFDAKTETPRGENVNCPLLIVKELKSGDRTITFGSFSASEYDWANERWNGRWNTNNGRGDVVYWMPLPAIPED